MGYFVSLLAGLVFGSFANVCIARLPKDESIRFPRSHCPRCGHALLIRDNIPIVSYILLRGRCRTYRAPISCQYPLIEAGLAALFVAAAWRYQGGLARILIADVLAFYLLSISVIDYHHRIIPDELSLSLLGIALAASPWNPFLMGDAKHRILESILAGVLGGAGMLGLAWAGEKI